MLGQNYFVSHILFILDTKPINYESAVACNYLIFIFLKVSPVE